MNKKRRRLRVIIYSIQLDANVRSQNARKNTASAMLLASNADPYANALIA